MCSGNHITHLHIFIHWLNSKLYRISHILYIVVNGEKKPLFSSFLCNLYSTDVVFTDSGMTWGIFEEALVV